LVVDLPFLVEDSERGAERDYYGAIKDNELSREMRNGTIRLLN